MQEILVKLDEPKARTVQHEHPLLLWAGLYDNILINCILHNYTVTVHFSKHTENNIHKNCVLHLTESLNLVILTGFNATHSGKYRIKTAFN